MTHDIRSRTRHRAGWRRLGVVLAVLALLVTACGDDDTEDTSEPEDAAGETEGTDTSEDSDTTTEGGGLLGEPDPASGDPVPVSFISDGRTASVDNSVRVEVAEALFEYLNDYRGGIAGRPMEFVNCETHGEPGQATACANEAVQAGVVLTLMPDTIVPLPVHTVMNENDIPIFVYALTEQTIHTDPENSFHLADPGATLTALPIDLARTSDVEKVTVVGFDIPAVSGFYEGAGAAAFEAAGIELEYVPVPPGQADITGQMIEVAEGDPTAVFIVGDASLCIATINGLDAAGFDGTIGSTSTCGEEAVREATGSAIEGLVLGSPAPIGDDEDPDIQLFEAILDEYAPGVEDRAMGLTTYITIMAAHTALDGISGEITPENIKETIRSAPFQPTPGGGGLEYDCGAAYPEVMPAVCTRGTLRVTLDAEGQPQLPYEVAGGWEGAEE